MRTLSLALLFALAASASAQKPLPLWPGKPPGLPNVAAGQQETSTPGDHPIAGQPITVLNNVSQPTLTVYPAPETKNTGAAVVVFPGGGYRILAYDLEGTEVCHWLNGIGVTCALVKYRVPDAGPYPKHTQDLADAQRAVRLVRQHASEWQINPKRIGVLGFSAGGHLVAVLGAHYAAAVYPPVDEADKLSARPDFSLLIYPGYLSKGGTSQIVPAEARPVATTPPSFLIQAEDDPVHVENAWAYFEALKQAKVPAEMHLYAEGGHGYGLRKTKLPVTDWPELVTIWLRTIGVTNP